MAVEWEDEGFVLTVSPHGEHAGVVHLFTRTQGRHAGLLPGAQSRRQSGMLQTGTHVIARWRARIESQLGTLSMEPKSGVPSPVLLDRAGLAAVAAMTSLLHAFMAERDPHPDLYDVSSDVLARLLRGNLPLLEIGASLACWELYLLSELGFGLDLDACALSGVTENLTYVSPRTGRAVCDVEAAPWKDRLFRLPPFLNDSAGRMVPESMADVRDAFRLTGHFLAQANGDGRVPTARDRFVARFR